MEELLVDPGTMTDGEKKALVEKARDLAYRYEGEYGSCPQAVLSAIQETFGLVEDDVIKAGHNLAGGAALSTEGTCGALVGGMMAISCRFGRPRSMFGKGPFMRNYELAKRLHDRFVEKFGSPICAGVQMHLFGRSYDLWDRGEYCHFEKAGAHKDKCTSVAGAVAEWTAELLLENM